MEIVQKQLIYVKETVQSYFSLQQGNNNDQLNRTSVSKEKLTQLWKENQKKTIEIINNSGNWPYGIATVVDKDKTEEYYHDKYNFDNRDLNEYHEDATEIPDFTS